MKPALSRAQSRELDRRAIEGGIPSLTLMENAGRAAAEIVAEVSPAPGRIWIVCGPGNNGGDGYVVARYLLERQRDVRIVSVVPPICLKGDALHNFEALERLSHSVSICATADTLPNLEAELCDLNAGDLIVDALFGTGLDRSLEGHFAQVIELLNRSAAKRIALDVPSGMCADTGTVLGTAMRAHVTLSFAQYKLGAFTAAGARHAGHVRVVDIGISADLVRSLDTAVEVLEAKDAATWLRPRELNTHKRQAGHVLCFAGAAGTSGAALLCAQGALRSGAGLVTLAGFPDTLATLEPRVFEVMTARMDETQLESSLDALLQTADSVVIGPGFGTGERERRVIRHVVLHANQPVVVDADAISCFAGQANEFAKSVGPLILTPHPGEMGRLLGISSAQVESDRFAVVARAAAQSGAVVVLKGAHTLIAQGDRTWINDAPTPVLAVAGSGDVLAGVIGALACETEPRRAAALGVYLHANSGRAWQRRVGSDRGMLAREIADGIPGQIAELATQRGALPD